MWSTWTCMMLAGFLTVGHFRRSNWSGWYNCNILQQYSANMFVAIYCKYVGCPKKNKKTWNPNIPWLSMIIRLSLIHDLPRQILVINCGENRAEGAKWLDHLDKRAAMLSPKPCRACAGRNLVARQDLFKVPVFLGHVFLAIIYIYIYVFIWFMTFK